MRFRFVIFESETCMLSSDKQVLICLVKLHIDLLTFFFPRNIQRLDVSESLLVTFTLERVGCVY